MLTEQKGIVRIERFWRQIFQQKKAIFAVAADAKHFRHRDRFTARQQVELIGFGGKAGQQRRIVAFHEDRAPGPVDSPCGVNFTARQFGSLADFTGAQLFV